MLEFIERLIKGKPKKILESLKERGRSKKRTLIISNEELKVLEDEREIITRKREYILYDEDIRKVRKYLSGRPIDIIIEGSAFIYTEVIPYEKSQYIDIKKYIENEVLREFSGEKEDYYYVYFLSEEGEYEIFITEDARLKNFVEVGYRSRFKLDKMYISLKNKYEVDDIPHIMKANKKKKPIKLWASIGLVLVIFFSGNFLYVLKLERDISTIEVLKEKVIENTKAEKLKLIEIQKKGNLLSKEACVQGRSDKKFKEEVVWIANLTPKTVRVRLIYWEKNNLTIEGCTENLEDLFKFVRDLEGDQKIENLVFDYILKENEIYTYLLELKVN